MKLGKNKIYISVCTKPLHFFLSNTHTSLKKRFSTEPFNLTLVSAVDINNLNVPDNFEKVSNMTYDNNVSGEKLVLIDIYEELNYHSINETEIKEMVHPTEKEHIYSFINATGNMYGCGELINVNGTSYVVEIMTEGTANETKIKEMVATLTEFNQLNNFTAANPNTL